MLMKRFCLLNCCIILLISCFAQFVFPQAVYWPYQSYDDFHYFARNAAKEVGRENTVKKPFSTNIILNPISLYQRNLSRSSCQYYPSCSRYTYAAIDKYGALKGLILGAERLIRCFYIADGSKYFKIGGFYYNPPIDLFRYKRSNSESSFQKFLITKFDKFADHASQSRPNSNFSPSPGGMAGESDSLIRLFLINELDIPELHFACHLYRERQFYRASTEFYRYLYQYPDNEYHDAIWLLIACCNFQAGRYREAARLFEKSISDTCLNRRYIFAQFMRGFSNYNAGNYQLAQEIWYDLLQRNNTDLYKNETLMAYFSVSLKLDDFQKLSYKLKQEAGNSVAENVDGELNKLQKGRKSPLLASIFSAVVPGGGQVYSGSYRDGVYSLAVNGGIGLLFYDAYRNGSLSAKIISGFFCFQFYLANIIGGKRAAEVHNELKIDRTIAEFQKMGKLRVQFPLIQRGDYLSLAIKKN